MFRIDDPVYQSQFLEQVQNHDAFVAGPYLDAHDHFASGKTTRELVEEGVLPRYFLRYGFHHDRPLYNHQEKSLLEALKGNNLVVSTGTGSGKTESFLMPILAHLAKEKEEGTLGSGVRALLIYPMNALANDQVERLRELLADTPEVTFGCYTGQTKQRQSQALAEYTKLNGARPRKNELISRDEMKENPPHILITNYAMLEYLMVRPGDNVFFMDDTWRFIVLDEAHVYRGSTGIEVSMLLRRLKATLQGCPLQYFLTSATLGDESEDEKVADFAANLCASSFSSAHVIRAVRVQMPLPRDPLDVPFSVYQAVFDQMEADEHIEAIGRKLLTEYPQWRLLEQAPLFDMIHRDRRYWQMRQLLKTPIAVSRMSELSGLTDAEIEVFVAVASACEYNGIRLLDARYHTFLRATDSVFITLSPSNRLFLNRHKEYADPRDGLTYKVFEINTCSSCHCIYLVGRINDQTGCLEQNAATEVNTVFYLGKQVSETDEDTENEESKIIPGTICARCGYFRKEKVKGAKHCEHGEEYEIPVVQLQTKARSQRLTKCVACEAVNSYGILRPFFTGQEAVTSVIATSLFNALPSTKSILTHTVIDDDPFGFGFGDAQDTIQIHQERLAKQFLCFSDSRQAAAYFASYLDTSYRKLLYRRCIVEQFSHMQHDEQLSAFCDNLSVLFDKQRILEETGYHAEKESWKAVLAEMKDASSDASLGNMGLFCIGLKPDSFSANPKLNMTSYEVTALFNTLISSLLLDLAVTIPCAMTDEDREFYAYGATACRYVELGGNAQRNLKSFIPQSATRSNKRLDYLVRMLERKKLSFESQAVRSMLHNLWNLMIANKILIFQEDGYQLDHNALYVLRPTQWYRCDKCHRMTPYNIAGTCITYRCNGTLHPVDPETELSNNHYFRLYHNLELRALRVKEHTAQLDRNRAYQYQQDFRDKKLDVLSCSTTFEMGVDVGSLETVFMRNMPPLPSNYAQRAGRAGRSKNSAAFALTFCNRSNHDFAYFNRPEDMISGKIHAPHFNVINEKIAIRHLYASALAFFWRTYPYLFSTVEEMYKQEDATYSKQGFALLKEYLLSHPKPLQQYLAECLPTELYDQFDCENFGWVNSLMSNENDAEGVLTRAIDEYVYEVNALEKARREAFEKHYSTSMLEQRLRTYRNEDILSFLSRKNVMPQYGFPVDTVSLTVSHRSNGEQYGVELQRDLALAISEYAPGSQVVANGQLFTGRYIKKIPQIGWKMYDYLICDHCKTLNIDPHTGNEANTRLTQCRMCANELDIQQLKTFIVPAFGFEIDPNQIKKPGMIRPTKTYRTDVSYVGYRNSIQMKRSKIGDVAVLSVFAAKDEMAVLNKSDFHVCTTCGYAEVGQGFMKVVQNEHRTAGGFPCVSKYLHRYSLGYRFETDVFQLLFPDIPLDPADEAKCYSVLYALLRGIVYTLDLEETDIAGCMQYTNEAHVQNAILIFYDTTPGGAGHVRRLEDARLLQRSIENALSLMKQCVCGGTDGHASCYGCLRSYRNQKQHDILERAMAIEYLQRIIH